MAVGRPSTYNDDSTMPRMESLSVLYTVQLCVIRSAVLLEAFHSGAMSIESVSAPP